ncbi:RNA polymerase II transcription factor B 52 kDa subunit [Savitreella phatthalungensis]
MNINEYLEQLPPTTTARLYSRPATCLAVFRLLPALARQYVMTMLYSSKSVRLEEFEAWALGPGGRNRQSVAYEKLRQLNIVKTTSDGFTLNDAFRKNMQLALTGGGSHRSFGVPCATRDGEIDEAFLDTWSTETWETILHFLVGTQQARMPGRAVVGLLEKGGLWAPGTGITSAGFQFLLQDGNAQLWTLLLQYLEVADNRGVDPVEIAHLLFMLGYLELGQDYTVEDLSPEAQTLLTDLCDFGIVYQRKDDRSKFFPTRLATTLVEAPGTSGYGDMMPSSTAASNSSSFVILETNYKLYAYTSSPLQIAVLDLFCQLTARFPNMVCGVLSRESIRRALATGITADQIVLYLSTHAHPQMRRASKGPLLPPTVVDQIRLWELEKDRLKATNGYLFRDFRQANEYEEAVRYARDVGVLVYENAAKKCFFTSDAGQAPVAAYVRRQTERRKAASAAAAASSAPTSNGAQSTPAIKQE